MTYRDLFVGTYSPADEQGIHLLRFDTDAGGLNGSAARQA
ncbi:lactonase family protein [Gordoniibacillus kamchatkensis]|nr:lactonase family protein [Paenibacillus sp. VKM B-2647]